MGPGGQPRRGDALIRIIAERRPELAQRLDRLRREAPEKFEEVLVTALLPQLEGALDEAERDMPPRRPGDDGPRPPGPQGGRPPQHRPGPPGGEGDGPQGGGPGARPPRPGLGPPGEMSEEQKALVDRIRALQDRSRDLERSSHDLANKLRQLGDGADKAAERGKLGDELRKNIAEEFEVRTQLRQAELGRLQGDVERLGKAVDRIRGELERRQSEREEIIKRRAEQLMGKEGDAW